MFDIPLVALNLAKLNLSPTHNLLLDGFGLLSGFLQPGCDRAFVDPEGGHNRRDWTALRQQAQHKVDHPQLTQLQQAIAARRVVWLRYHSYRTGERLEREVEPETLTYNQGVWYLGGYCRLREGPRSFRLDRADDLRVLDERFAPRSVAPAAAEPVTVRVRFAATTLRWVRERQHFGYVADESDTVLRYSVSDPYEMLPWLLSWGANAEVLEPGALRARAREEARRLLQILT